MLYFFIYLVSRSKDDVLIEVPKIIKEDGPQSNSTNTQASEGGANQGLNEALS
jgi:hypothetical protein